MFENRTTVFKNSKPYNSVENHTTAHKIEMFENRTTVY